MAFRSDNLAFLPFRHFSFYAAWLYMIIFTSWTSKATNHCGSNCLRLAWFGSFSSTDNVSTTLLDQLDRVAEGNGRLER